MRTTLIRFRSYKSTINVPNLTMPIKYSPIQDASHIQDFITANFQYNKKTFVLEDGPPYANGEPHVGHALNKILKDIVRRYKLITGYNVSYIPGWDCHGLPIELKASEKLSMTDSTDNIRIEASKVAHHYLDVQMKQFRSWAVGGNWENRYATFDKSYQSRELLAFNILQKKGLVFRDSLPIFWSCSSRTALAESELEYKENHESLAAYVALALRPSGLLGSDAVSLLVWTTTPWTLVANEAAAVNENMKYLLCKFEKGNKKIILAGFCLEKMRQILQDPLIVERDLFGRDLVGLQYSHPLRDSVACTVLDASFVSSSKGGTGIVHMAPQHGKDDFASLAASAISKSLPWVDDEGIYTEQCGAELRGLSIFDSGMSKVLSLLGNDVLHLHKHLHSYPYDWRTKKPVITRLSTQWFIDVAKLSERALAEYRKVAVYPSSMREAMVAFISKRPNWCISRQRCWGLAIPVLYRSDGDVIVDEDFIRNVTRRVAEHGSDFWWQLGITDLVPGHFLDKWNVSDPAKLRRSTDIFDIWFDSGLSWWCRHRESVDGESPVEPADVYLEGLDQFRGWFSASLLMGVALQDRAPYKTIVSHGFTVDSSGQKMSKSLGNVLDPRQMATRYGVDVLRYWACVSGLGARSAISHELMLQLQSKYCGFRNMFRFLLGCQPVTGSNDNGDPLLPQDRYIVHLLSQHYIPRLASLYEQFSFEPVPALLEEVVARVSNFYFTLIKDRLYCDTVDSDTHRSAIATVLILLRLLLPLFEPVFPCLVHEVLHYNRHHHTLSVDWPTTDLLLGCRYETVAVVMDTVLLPLRQEVHKSASNFGGSSANSNPWAHLHIELAPENVELLAGLREQGWARPGIHSPLTELLRCAEAQLLTPHELQLDAQHQHSVLVAGQRWTVQVRQTDNAQCPRCRRFVAVEPATPCERCRAVLRHIPAREHI